MNSAVKTSGDLDKLASLGSASLYPEKVKILIGSGTCGLAMGARAVEEAALATVKKLKADATVSRIGCIGFCSQEPLLDIVLPGGPRVSFGSMTAPRRVPSSRPISQKAISAARSRWAGFLRGARVHRRRAQLRFKPGGRGNPGMVEARFLPAPEKSDHAELRFH